MSKPLPSTLHNNDIPAFVTNFQTIIALVVLELKILFKKIQNGGPTLI